MNNWRDLILKAFTPKVSKLTLVADPDGLLLEERILKGIRERGFDLITFEDHVAFRYAYESKYRSLWDNGLDTELVVVLRSPLNDLDTLPFDLLQAGRSLVFSIGDLFPNLSYPVVACLDRALFDGLFEAYRTVLPEPLGDNSTKDFILRHVFEIAPELIRQPQDLLLMLLRKHYKGIKIPQILDERLIWLLRNSKSGFSDWPLETIVPDRQAFFAFLQERWPAFVDSYLLRKQQRVGDSRKEYGLKFPGPLELPLDHEDIRVYIDNLFLEGFIEPIYHESGEVLSNTWLTCGIKTSPEETKLWRINGLIDRFKDEIPYQDCRYTEWLRFANRFCELLALVFEVETEVHQSTRKKLEEVDFKVDQIFRDWIYEHFGELINLPPNPPVMLHHILRYLTRKLEEQPNQRIALVVLDGLSIPQWVTIRNVVKRQLLEYTFLESCVFSWVPTITSVCRQAIFAGNPPLYFPSSIYTTDKEPVLWRRFWENVGLRKEEIDYLKCPDGSGIVRLKEALTKHRLKVIGIVIDIIDRIMHGMELGASGMQSQIKHWANQKSLSNLIKILCDEEFSVFLVSDHGNVEAKGIGRIEGGSIPETMGQRVIVYKDQSLLRATKRDFPQLLEWPPVGLPDCYFPLLAPYRGSFSPKEKIGICHGGVSIEEVLVPFVEVLRPQR